MQNKDQMHPEDMRNLFLFFIISLAVYFLYDHFIAKPQVQAIRAQRAAVEQTAKIEAPDAAKAAQETRPRAEVIAQVPRIPIENPEVTGSISLRGGRIDDLSLRKYFETLEKKKNVVLLSPRGTAFPRYVDYGWVAGGGERVNLPGPETPWQVKGAARKLTPGNPVTLVWNNGQGLVFEREFALDEHYLFTLTQRVRNNTGREITLYPYGLVSQTGQPPMGDGRYILHEGAVGYIGGELHEVNYKDLEKKPLQTVEATEGWLGLTEKYWLTGLIPSQLENVKFRFSYSPAPGPDARPRYQADFTGAGITLIPGDSAEVSSHMFSGAKRVLLLADYEKQLGVPHFDLAVDFGIFYFLTKPFYYALHYLNQWAGNLGIAIIIFTFILRMAVFPLTNVSYRSFAKMKKVSPQIVALRDQYGEDKQKLQEELVKMYQKEGVNPLAGCLPILIQIPIFFAMYKVLYVTIETRHAPFFGWIQDLSAPDPTSIFNLFGLLPYDVPGFLQIGVWPCLMLIAMLIQKKLNPPPQDPIQRDMMRYFPFVITYVLSRFASGLVVYWTVSAALSVLQQMYIMRSLNVPIHLFGETDEERKLEEAVEKGPALHPLAEMAEEEVEEALFGHDEEGQPKEISPPKKKKKKKKK